jgi:hypothetical protein
MSKSEREQEIPWLPVVKAMYDGVHVERYEEGCEWEYQPFAPMGSKTDLSREDIESALYYMERSGLIHEPKEGVLALTEIGLQFAHDHSTKERQNRINRTIMLAAIITALAPALSNWPPDNPLFEQIPADWNAVLIIGGLLVAGGILLLLFVELYYLEVKPRLRKYT